MYVSVLAIVCVVVSPCSRVLVCPPISMRVVC